MIGDYTYHNNQPQLMLATLTPEKKILTLKEAGVLVSPSPITIGEQKIVFCPKFYGLTACNWVSLARDFRYGAQSEIA